MGCPNRSLHTGSLSCHSVDQLRSHDLPIVCGVYPQKGKRALACHIVPGTPSMHFGKRGNLGSRCPSRSRAFPRSRPTARRWPSGCGPGGKRRRLVQEPAEPLHDLLPRTLEADDPDLRIEADRLFDIRQVERGHVAHEPLAARLQNPFQPLADPRSARLGHPRQQRRLLVGNATIGLLIEDLGQQQRAALASPHPENDLAFHESPAE